jgi:hypothetical protein
MRTLLWVIPLFALQAPAEVAAQCSCGPDFCIGDARVAKRLSAKKDSLRRQGYPADLVALFDKSEPCYAAIDRAPDGFSLMTVKPNGDNLVTQWSEDNEEAAKRAIEVGDLSAFYKFNVRKAFACCERPKAEDRADWNPNLSLSTGQAISCQKLSSAIRCR